MDTHALPPLIRVVPRLVPTYNMGRLVLAQSWSICISLMQEFYCLDAVNKMNALGLQMHGQGGQLSLALFGGGGRGGLPSANTL